MGSTSAILENDALLDTEQRTALLRNVRDEAQWLVRMVENLLSITRMSGGDTQILNKELEAAEEVLASVADKFRQRFDGIALSLAVPREPLFVPMDAILIEQVLLNLLENAACHGRGSETGPFPVDRAPPPLSLRSATTAWGLRRRYCPAFSLPPCAAGPPTTGGIWESDCRCAVPSSRPTAGPCPPPTRRRAARCSASHCP